MANKFFIVSAVVLFIIVTSCEKIKDTFRKDVVVRAAAVTFPIEAAAAGAGTFAEFSVTLNIDSILHAQDDRLDGSNIKSVHVKSFQLTLLNSTNEDNFSSFSMLAASLSSDGNTNWITIAENDNIALDARNNVELHPSAGAELRPYLRTAPLHYRLSGNLRKETSRTLQCRASIEFDVEAGL